MVYNIFTNIFEAIMESKQTEALVKPAKDTRVKTEDVTNTKGLTFQSFGLSQDVLLVSE